MRFSATQGWSSFFKGVKRLARTMLASDDPVRVVAAANFMSEMEQTSLKVCISIYIKLSPIAGSTVSLRFGRVQPDSLC